MPTNLESQLTFDETYISASEIEARCGVSRTAVLYARRRGVLPNAISVGDCRIYIWVRKEVEPHLKIWQDKLNGNAANKQALPV